MEESMPTENPQDAAIAQSFWDTPVSEDERIPIWLDCDTGHDDAFAILLAAECPRMKLLGVSSVHGNASTENTTRNALAVLEAIGRRDVPVYVGSSKPFCRKAHYAPDIHGESGLDGTTVLPTPVAAAKTHEAGPIGAMYQALSQYPGKAWLVSTGTLTNIALLFAVYPQLASQIAGLSIMGGAIGGFFTYAPLGRLNTRLQYDKELHKLLPGGLPDDSDMTIPEVAKQFRELGLINGDADMNDEKVHMLLEQARLSFGNSTPFAEFNIYCDPESACAIFSNSILAAKTTLVPLDLTHQVLGTKLVQSMIKFGRENDAASKPISLVRQLFHEIMTYFGNTYDREFRMPSPPLHDPLAVAAALAPALFEDNDGERFEVHVVRSGDDDLTASERHGKGTGQCGRTIAKMLEKGKEGIRIPRSLNVAVFWNMIDLALSSAEASKIKQDSAAQ